MTAFKGGGNLDMNGVLMTRINFLAWQKQKIIISNAQEIFNKF